MEFWNESFLWFHQYKNVNREIGFMSLIVKCPNVYTHEHMKPEGKYAM